MDSFKKSLALCGVITVLGFGSCISTTDELDLDKEISLDMQIGRGGLSIPIGSLDTLYLDSLIKVGDDTVLDTLDGGLFGFSMGDSISKVSLSIGAVQIDIDPPTIDPISTSFESPTVSDVEIPERTNTTHVEIDSISISGINKKLPSLVSSFQTDPIEVTGYGISAPVVLPPIVFQNKEMSCGFIYPFPEDLKKLNKVWFGTPGTKTGQKLRLDVDLSGVYSLLASPNIRVTSFQITFPDNFVVGKDAALSKYIPNKCVTADENVFSISMGTSESVTGIGTDGILPISFYIKEADFTDYNVDQEIDFSGKKVRYDLEIAISGTTDLNGTEYFHVGVSMDTRLTMADIEAETNSKEVTLNEETLSSSCDVTGLAGISRVDDITFVPDQSMIYLSISDLGIDPFKLKSGSSDFVLNFSDKFTFDTDYCEDEAGHEVGTWAGSKLTLDASKAMGHTVKLKVLSLAVNQDVVGTNSSINFTTNVDYRGKVVVDEATGITLSDLNKLTNKDVVVKVWGKFVVKNAVIETGEMRNDFCDSTEISINEKVDDALLMIKRIDLVEAASVNLNLLFENVPKTIEELIFSGFTVEFPDFIMLNYNGSDNRISTVGNKLFIDGILSDELHSLTGFDINGLEISGMEFRKGCEIKNGYLVLDNQKVFIKGAVTVDNQKINNEELDVITVTPTVGFETIKVKSVYGKVNPSIDPVSEEVSLDLGDADFFQNENNSLSLSDPQITINLTSTVTVPIDIDLSLSSLNSKGEYIAQDIAPDDGPIHLSRCDTLADSRTTTLVISKNYRPQPLSDDTVIVRMSRLSELMEKIPDKIMFNLTAKADTTVNHYIDLTRELCVTGEYNVSIPLQFDNLYIEYSDTIKDLGKDLADVGDKIEEAELQILGDVESTIPLGVTLTATAYNENWIRLNDIKIDSCFISAGREDTITTSPMVLDLKVRNGKLADLEYIVFTAKCESGQENASIRKGQYLYIKKLRLNLPEGLKIDLTEKKEK